MASASLNFPTADPGNKPDSLGVQLNLNLYNFDNPDAQFCPYVLTSPRSLEACSNLGVKPVELLHKPLTEFKQQITQGMTAEEVLRLYQEQEQTRIEKLEKCRHERKSMILSQKKIQRSLSASPLSQRKKENDLHNREQILDNRYNFDEALAEESDEGHDSHQSKTDSFRSKTSGSTRKRTDSWSAPTSPFRSVLLSSVVPITSPILVAKLKDSPRFGLSLPSKDIKLMELMLHRHQTQVADEELKACARQIWAEELEHFQRRQQIEEKDRWHRVTSPQTQDEVHERLQEVKDRIAFMQQQKRRELLDKEEKLRKSIRDQHALKRQKSARSRERSEERKRIQEKRLEDQQKQESEHAHAHLSEVQEHLEKANKIKIQNETKQKVKVQNQKEDEKRKQWKMESMHSSFSESELQLEALTLKEKQVELRRQEIVLQRQHSQKKRTETSEERQRAAKTNQLELDKALETWRDRVSNYQEEANRRALQRANETIESRRAKVREDRLAKEAEHRKNLERIRAEEEARYLEKLLKMCDREKQTEMFVLQKEAAIEQSRCLAQAASDLREHLRQKLEEDILKPSKSLTSSSYAKTPGPPTPARRKCLKDLRKSKSFFC